MTAIKPKPKKTAPKKAASTTAAKPAVVLSDKAFDFKFDKTTHDFGTITEGSQVKTTFILTNTGKEPIVVTNHEVGCGCTTPEYTKEPIMPGKSTPIVVGFNSAGKSGAQDKDVKLNFANGEKTSVNFKCFVGEKAKVDPLPQGGSVNLKPKKY